ncbi:carbohydrate ABC transporter permease [Ensifer adhaerens]|jgi:multiple sugar transport system permease protein|uniref:Sugar ABC transporter permease n=1 Tax=Ensifer adhaerens TaxID=106592 RepID=A0A9Q8YEM2_ENSAD|nr:MULTISPECIES: sugar ABC transporter permease [Ensifer]KSV62969.1 ABC transporter permease [Sinorhizobium sp. GL2]KSV79241.1 ABC transporter permease [Sinorhizobium sp. GW3]OWZ93940.1 ABC transporter permease [Sinorhizobium sp. LM21]ANK75433.1 ABC transporter permease [Ensifer adhaerens]KDP72829.1 ABC transporter permease [Ensifer adhaerens]
MTRNDPIKHFFIWPALIIVLMISIFPLVYSLTTSFMSMRLVPPTPARFVGFGNYLDLLQNPRFWHVAGTTTLIAFISVGLQYVIGLSVALALNSRVPGEGIFRVSFLLPMLVAPVAVALIARQVLNPTMGPLNELMTAIGFPNLPFLTQTSWALGSIIAVEVWQWTPFVILMLLAGLQTLPDDVYEAAALENATPWQQFRDITFPMLLPISVAVVFIRLIESYKIIDTVFVMTGGGPGISTETLTLFAYQEGFKKFNLGYTSALSFLFLIVITVIGLVYLAILKPYLEKHK